PEGSTLALTVNGYTDPGTDTPTAVVISWGDGNTTALTAGQVTTLRGGGSVALSHPYPDGTIGYTISASVTDEDGAFANAGSKAITVTNVAPTLSLAGGGSPAEGSPFT